VTNSQRLQLEQSEKRQKINDLLGKETLEDSARTELETLTKRMQQIEVELRAAIVSESAAEKRALESQPDAEMRERLELRSKASLTSYLRAALAGRRVDGAEAELAEAAGVGEGIPLELWDTPKPEHRADATTGAPGTTGVNLAPIQPAVFASSVLPKLGVQMPRVASGTYATGTISTSLTASSKAKGAAQEATAAAFTVSTVTPKRVSARLGVRIEDIASVGVGNFESALRQNLALVLSDALDTQGLNGDGQAPNLTGLFGRLTDPTDPTAIAKFDDFVGAFADGIDGLWASTTRDVAIVCGPATYKLSAKAFRDVGTNNGHRGDVAFSDYAMAHFGGFWTSKRMPDAASNIQQAILHRKGRTGLRTAVCPHWGAVSIDDIYSGSASGERYLTLHVLLGDVILVQPDAYAQVAFKLA
jgi:hypothetical protein